MISKPVGSISFLVKTRALLVIFEILFTETMQSSTRKGIKEK
jgi:hypothetical protein